MKKHSLFKSILIMLALLVIVSYFAPDRSEAISYLGIGTVFLNSIQSFYYFWDTALFIFVVGGFYGVLNKTGAYKKLVDMVVSKFKPNSKKFVFVITALFALVSSLTGLTVSLLVFVPFVISIILLLGYDKLVAISSTIGAIAVGFIGGIFTTLRDPNAYSTSYVTFEQFANIDKFANIFPKLILLFVGVAILIYFINKHIGDVEAKKVKYDFNDEEDVMISEVKGNYKDIKVWPLITVLSIVFVLLVLGYMPWNSLFGLTIFDDFHAWLTSIKIGEFAIFNNIISSSFYAFGQWGQLGSYMMLVVVLFIAMLVIKFICKIKFDDMIDGFISGTKRMLPTAVLASLSFAVLVCAYNNGFIESLIKNVSEAAGSLNVVLASLFTLLGSLLYQDIFYTASGVFTPILGVVTDETLYSVLALNFQAMFGLMMLVGPTSILLIIGLTYLNIPYTTWLKYIWRLLLMLFIMIFVVLVIVSLV